MVNEKKKVVRRIKATSNNSQSTALAKPASKKIVNSDKSDKSKLNSKNKATKSDKKTFLGRNNLPKNNNRHKPLIVRPFLAIGRYVKESWQELRQVQWPNRRESWKLTLGVIAFCAIICILVVLFDWVSQLIVKEVIL